MARLFAGQALPAGDNVAVVTNARGPALLAADALQAAGLNLPAEGSANPVTLPVMADAAPFTASALEELLRKFYRLPRPARHLRAGRNWPRPAGVAAAVREAVAAARAAGEAKPVVACFMASEGVGASLSPAEANRSRPTAFPKPPRRALARVRHGTRRGADAPLGVVPGLSRG